MCKSIFDDHVVKVDDAVHIKTTNSTYVPQMAWVHCCIAIDSTLNRLTVVVNGQQLEDKAFPIPSGAQPPSNLTGNVLVFKNYIGIWYQSKNKVSNLNIFSKLMTLPEMVSRTAGDNCGKADGD